VALRSIAELSVALSAYVLSSDRSVQQVIQCSLNSQPAILARELEMLLPNVGYTEIDRDGTMTRESGTLHMLGKVLDISPCLDDVALYEARAGRLK